MKNPLLAELVVTSLLVGLIWVIQLLTYPSFEFVGTENYTQYHRFHVAAITPLVAPMMIFEFLISAYNFLTLSYSRNWGVVLALLLVIIWLATAFLSVPIHNQLVVSKDIYLIKKLVLSNWLRTISWTLRLIILFYLIDNKKYS